MCNYRGVSSSMLAGFPAGFEASVAYRSAKKALHTEAARGRASSRGSSSPAATPGPSRRASAGRPCASANAACASPQRASARAAGARASQRWAPTAFPMPGSAPAAAASLSGGAPSSEAPRASSASSSAARWRVTCHIHIKIQTNKYTTELDNQYVQPAGVTPGALRASRVEGAMAMHAERPYLPP